MHILICTNEAGRVPSTAKTDGNRGRLQAKTKETAAMLDRHEANSQLPLISCLLLFQRGGSVASLSGTEPYTLYFFVSLSRLSSLFLFIFAVFCAFSIILRS